MSKHEIPDELQNKLEEFSVETPEIPIKVSKLERLANIIHAPAKNPIDFLNIKGTSITRLVLYPFILIIALLFGPMFLI
ncbi:hypothetical protein ACLIA0_12790 [Bacillaceae bacterium W0354]